MSSDSIEMSYDLIEMSSDLIELEMSSDFIEMSLDSIEMWASALCTFYNNPAPLNGSMQFHYCTLVTREPEQTTLLFHWSAACGVTPHGLHTADRR